MWRQGIVQAAICCFVISVANIRLMRPAAVCVPPQHHLLARPCTAEAMRNTDISVFLSLV
jgi:hypothetical protein